MTKSADFELKDLSPLFLVSDLERSITFYTQVLGFDIRFRYEDFYAGLGKDGFSIHLKSGQPIVGERENRKSNEHIDMTFLIGGIEKIYDDLTSHSVNIIQPLRDMPYGREFYISDPDGYIISFLE